MHYWIPLLLISFVSVSALEDGSTISVYLENDLFANTDRNTNGTKVSVVSPDIDWNREINQGQICCLLSACYLSKHFLLLPMPKIGYLKNQELDGILRLRNRHTTLSLSLVNKCIPRNNRNVILSAE